MSTTLAAEPELILFDCDGVLVDSETIACRIDAALFTAAGFPLCFEDIRREFVGISATAMCRAIEQRFGRKLPTDMPQRLLTAAVEAFETQLTPIPAWMRRLRRCRARVAWRLPVIRPESGAHWKSRAYFTISIRICSARSWWNAASLPRTSSSTPHVRWALTRLGAS